MNRLITLLTAALLIPMALCAQKTKKVEGEYTYHGNDNQSLAQCKQLALEGARLDAIAREFGTQVNQDIVQHDRVSNGEENTYFDAQSRTSVKGEWIADEGEPVFTVAHDAAGNPIVTCRVKGHARELTNKAVDFTATPMRNGSRSTDFDSGDKLSLLFRAPVDGYVAVFLIDTEETAYTLLPYLSNTSGRVKVKRGEQRTFFTADDQRAGGELPDEMILSTADDTERNLLYVVFSPTPFARPNDRPGDSDLMPRSMPRRDFDRWLRKCQNNDPEFSIQTFNLQISKH